MISETKSDCEKSWVGKGVFTFCPIHGYYFKSGSCKFLDTSKRDLCLNENKEILKVAPYDSESLTPRQQEALKLYNDGNSFQSIANSLNIKKGTAQDLINRAIRKVRGMSLTVKRMPLTIAQSSPLTVRLHNDEFKCKVQCDYERIKGDIKNLGRNLEYKLIKSNILFIKVHKNSTLTVRFLKDIECENESECKVRADKRLEDWLKNFNIDGINFILNSKLINRHYGLLGSSFAKKVTDDRRLFIVRDFDGSVRLRIDLSRGAEIDAEHPEKGLNDVKQTREYFNAIIDKPHYTPDEAKIEIDEQKDKLKYVIDVLHEFATEFKVHSVVQHKQETNMDKMANMLDKLSSKLDSTCIIPNLVDSSNSLVISPTIQKSDSEDEKKGKLTLFKRNRIKSFIEQFK